MPACSGVTRGITSWGRRGRHRVWRVRWVERPGMVAEVTGPDDLMTAFRLVCRDEVLTRLPWRPTDDRT